jgi:hypothetical protein
MTMYEDLAKSVLVMAANASMPDTFWQTDSRIRLACQTLGWETHIVREWAWRASDERWKPDEARSASDTKLIRQYRSLTAETYWEDSGLAVWDEQRFKEVIDLAKFDADPDNPERLV